MQRTIGFTMLRRILALLALAGTLQLAVMPGHAWAEYVEDYQEEYTDGYDGDSADGPGTRYRKCRAEAWADYNDCLMEDPGDTSHETGCFFAWDLDNIGCDTRLILDVAGIAGLFK